jgi:hypothetical protein
MMRVATGRELVQRRSGSENVLSNSQFSSSTPPVETSTIAQEAVIVTIPEIVESARPSDSEADSETGASKV